MTDLYRVLYCSRNEIAGPVDAVRAEIGGILAKSRANNARDGITGGLLYGVDCFAQVLEGPYEAVQDAVERIQCDDRHTDVAVLQSGPVAARDFPDWSMAFAGAGTDEATGAALTEAFAGRSVVGEHLLALLKRVVVREDAWLSPDCPMFGTRAA